MRHVGGYVFLIAESKSAAGGAKLSRGGRGLCGPLPFLGFLKPRLLRYAARSLVIVTGDPKLLTVLSGHLCGSLLASPSSSLCSSLGQVEGGALPLRCLWIAPLLSPFAGFPPGTQA